VNHRQSVLGHEQQLAYRCLRLLQRRTGLRVEQDMLLLNQRLVTTRHGGRHVNGALTTGPVVRHKNNRFRGMLKHQSHLHVVDQSWVHVTGNADRHDEMNVGQGVA